MTAPAHALVTGASRGIGAAIARRLAGDGFAVTVNYAGNAAAAQSTLAAIRDAGGHGVAVQADVSDPGQAARLFSDAEAALGPLQVLVNSAGVLSMTTIADSDDALFDRIVGVNLKGSFNMLREAARRMQDGGRIVNLSTSLTGTRLPTYGVYTATKAAVEAMTSILAKELRGRNITVNAVAPGPTATEMFFEGKTQARIQALADMTPLQRLGTPDDIAAAVAFLAGPDGGWINGQTLRANGGLI